MVSTSSFLLVLVAGLAHANIPCSLYDVTTLKGSRLEVHSRTNAVGLPTNTSGYPGFADSLQNSKLTCRFEDAESCSGWTLHGFERVQLLLSDPIYGWRKVEQKSTHVDDVGRIISSEEYIQRHSILYQYDFSDQSNYTVRFNTGSNSVFYISTRGGIEAVGLKFSVNPSDSTVVTFQEKIFIHGSSIPRFYDRRYGNRHGYHESDGTSQGVVKLPVDDINPTVFLRKQNGRICLWMQNEEHSEKCLFSDSKGSNAFSVILDNEFRRPEFEVFESGTSAMRLIGTNGSASNVTFDVTPSRELCISLRYFLEKGATAIVQFIANNALQSILHSATLTGTGEFVSKQFSMIVEDTDTIRITFGTKFANSFSLITARKCSSKDLDILISKAENTCNRTDELSESYTNSQTCSEKVGFSTTCSIRTRPSSGSNKKCHHGGLVINGWCRCLPGFFGTACEKVCPPGRFGADCRGACVDDHECKGTSLAAPGLSFECARGFTGSDCKKSCEYGFYGPNCRLVCGQCLYGTCNSFTGHCTGPCQKGFRNPSCQEQLASTGKINILSTTFDSAEISVDVAELSEAEMKSYPMVKLLFKQSKFKDSAWTTVILPLTSRTTNFTLDNLEYGNKYFVDAVLVHEGGDYYQKTMWTITNDPTSFSTDCLVGKFVKVDVIAEETRLDVNWEFASSERYSCEISGFILEVFLPEMDEPIRKISDPEKRNVTVDAVLIRHGTFRLGAMYTTKGTVWTYHEFSSKIIDVERTFKVVNKSTRSIDFSWSSSDGLTSDDVNCVPEPVLCVDRQLPSKRQKVRLGDFSMRGLAPFTTYKCSLETSRLRASTMTQQDLPSAPPKPQDQPVQATNTTAFIQWKNADCLDINGIPKGFRVELWHGNTNEATTTTSSITFKTFYVDLLPETSYEAKVFVVNQLGWNAAQFLSIPFKTKSTTPNAVTDLVVYKRTRNDLWLRWSPPESESTETTIIAYKVTASAPEVETQSLETAPVQCSIWPEYVCYRLRSLVPDTEYTIKIQAKNNKVDSFGPSTVTKQMTKEGVPDMPQNVHIRNRTASSAVLEWEVPLMLNSNPKFFVLTLEQTDENNSQEKPTDSLEKKMFIIEGKRMYEAKFDQLNPATTYVATISAGLRGQRTMISVNTPAKDPPAPPAPVVKDPSGSKLVLHGIQHDPDSLKTLSAYLLLVTTNDTLSSNHGIANDDLAASLVSKFANSFFVAHEFSANLTEEVFTFASKPASNGNLSLIQNTRLEPGQMYGFALAAVSTYCGAHAVSVSPVTFFSN